VRQETLRRATAQGAMIALGTVVIVAHLLLVAGSVNDTLAAPAAR
jgi:hypothetical protein